MGGATSRFQRARNQELCGYGLVISFHFTSALPSRCVQIICTDAHGHVELECGGDGQFVATTSKRIGDDFRELINFYGDHFL